MVKVRYLVVMVTVISSEIYFVNDICPQKYGTPSVFMCVRPINMFSRQVLASNS